MASPGVGFSNAAGNLTLASNPAADPAVAPAATGTAGLGGGAHTIATATQGVGSVTMNGTLTINAPTSTEAGTFKGTVTFTVAATAPAGV